MVILQHRRERFHPFNTARIVRQALSRSELLVAHNHELADRFDAMTLSPKVGLLYPDQNAPVLDELEPDQMPDQLVVIDGTWHQAKTLLRDIPRLETLPKVRLAPTLPGQYQIRREPNQHALSTLEATVSALTSIEPETVGMEKLTGAFQRMIRDQIGNKSSNWRQNSKRRRGSLNIPKSLTGDPANIVIAYGEREPGRRGDRKQRRSEQLMPVYWTATRLDRSDVFECLIQSDSLSDDSFLKHLRLDPGVVSSAVSMEEFCRRWQAFLRPADQVFVDRQSTANLLVHSGAGPDDCINLKSIAVNQEAIRFDTHQVSLSIPRAQQRLACCVRFVESLDVSCNVSRLKPSHQRALTLIANVGAKTLAAYDSER